MTIQTDWRKWLQALTPSPRPGDKHKGCRVKVGEKNPPKPNIETTQTDNNVQKKSKWEPKIPRSMDTTSQTGGDAVKNGKTKTEDKDAQKSWTSPGLSQQGCNAGKSRKTCKGSRQPTQQSWEDTKANNTK